MNTEEVVALFEKSRREREPALLHDLAVSCASYIAEIDGSSTDVSAYLEQRLTPLVGLMRTDERVRSAVERMAKDGRQLSQRGRSDCRCGLSVKSCADHASSVGRDMWLAGLQRGLELAKEHAFLTSDRQYEPEYIDWTEVEKAIERE